MQQGHWTHYLFSTAERESGRHSRTRPGPGQRHSSAYEHQKTLHWPLLWVGQILERPDQVRGNSWVVSMQIYFISTDLPPCNIENLNQFVWNVKLLLPRPTKGISNERSTGAKMSIKRTRLRWRWERYVNKLTMPNRISWYVADNNFLCFQILSIAFTGQKCAFHGTGRRGCKRIRLRDASGHTFSGWCG